MIKFRTAVILVATVAAVLVGLCLTRWCAPERWYAYFDYAREVKPIHFYGRVVDQGGNPVAGAQIDIWIGAVDPGYLAGGKRISKGKELHVSSGTDGSFTVDGVSGRYLVIKRVSRLGFDPVPAPDADLSNPPGQPGPWLYDFASETPAYRYDSDPQNPAVFPITRPGEARSRGPSRGGKR